MNFYEFIPFKGGAKYRSSMPPNRTVNTGSLTSKSLDLHDHNSGQAFFIQLAIIIADVIVVSRLLVRS